MWHRSFWLYQIYWFLRLFLRFWLYNMTLRVDATLNLCRMCAHLLCCFKVSNLHALLYSSSGKNATGSFLLLFLTRLTIGCVFLFTLILLFLCCFQLFLFRFSNTLFFPLLLSGECPGNGEFLPYPCTIRFFEYAGGEGYGALGEA